MTAHKTHFAIADGTACGRYADVRRSTEDPNRVTCRTCGSSDEVQVARVIAEATRVAAIAAQPPRPVLNPWSGKPIVCRYCGHGEFRYAGRSLDTHNHECAKCGGMNHTMTETGMSA